MAPGPQLPGDVGVAVDRPLLVRVDRLDARLDQDGVGRKPLGLLDLLLGEDHAPWDGAPGLVPGPDAALVRAVDAMPLVVLDPLDVRCPLVSWLGDVGV